MSVGLTPNGWVLRAVGAPLSAIVLLAGCGRVTDPAGSGDGGGRNSGPHGVDQVGRAADGQLSVRAGGWLPGVLGADAGS